MCPFYAVPGGFLPKEVDGGILKKDRCIKFGWKSGGLLRKHVSYNTTPKNIVFLTIENVISGDSSSGKIVTSDILSDVWVPH